jgi:hypothetical protein
MLSLAGVEHRGRNPTRRHEFDQTYRQALLEELREYGWSTARGVLQHDVELGNVDRRRGRRAALRTFADR